MTDLPHDGATIGPGRVLCRHCAQPVAKAPYLAFWYHLGGAGAAAIPCSRDGGATDRTTAAPALSGVAE